MGAGRNPSTSVASPFGTLPQKITRGFEKLGSLLLVTRQGGVVARYDPTALGTAQ